MLRLFKTHFRPCSTFVTVKEALKVESIGKRIKIQGWVKGTRSQRINTFIDVDDGVSIGGKKVQVLIESSMVPETLRYHSAVEVEGKMRKSDHPGQEVEMEADSIKVVASIENEDYPFKPRHKYNDDFPRNFLHYRSKLNDFASLLRIRSATSHAIHDYFRRNDFVQIHTPILTSNDCEGGGELFQVLPANESISKKMKKKSVKDVKQAYFDCNAYLTVSGQLHLEAMCNGLKNVYTFSPAFRAEMGQTRRHLAEFSMIEAEVAFMENIQSLLTLQESLIKETVRSVLDSHEADILNYLKLNSLKQKSKNQAVKEDIGHIEKILDNDFKVMTYDEAFTIVENANVQFETKPDRSEGLGKEHELYLVEQYCQNVPVFVIEWPKEIKSFYARRSTSNPNHVQACDLLFPTVGELCGGSLREDDYKVLKENIVDKEGLEWYLDLRASGAAPMGGFGLGFERLIQFMLKVNNIRDAIPFPRSPHSCKL